MTPAHWQKIKEIIASALELPAEQWSAFLEQACGGDAHLQAEIKTMLDAASHSRATRLLPGDLIGGQYRIARMIGQGGFGETYLAHDQKLENRAVVVKVLRSAGAVAGVAADLRHEVEALAALDHPGVVAPLAAGHLDNGEPYLVMQFVDGCTLSNLIVEGGMALDRAAAILRQIGSALSAVHARNILHRDLKPANIMVQTLPGGDHIRLIDFGIARVLAGGAATSVLTAPVGSLSYMAPEQFQGRSTRGSDIYAMAVVAYELLTGTRPARTDVPAGAAAPGLAELHPRNIRPAIPEAAEVLILQGLSADPAMRPSDAEAYGEKLSEALTRPSATAGPRWLWLILLLICALVGGGGTWAVLQYTRAHKLRSAAILPSALLEVTLRIEGKDDVIRHSSAMRSELAQDETFRFEIAANASGHLYLLTEAGGPGGLLTVLFPSVTTNGYSSFIAGQKPALIPDKDPWGFKPGAAADRVWIVWSPVPVEPLENAARWAQEPHQGVVKDEGEARALRDALAKWRKLPDAGRGGGLALDARAGPAAIVLEIDHR